MGAARSMYRQDYTLEHCMEISGWPAEVFDGALEVQRILDEAATRRPRHRRPLGPRHGCELARHDPLCPRPSRLGHGSGGCGVRNATPRRPPR